MEDAVSSAGPGAALLLILAASVLWGIPMALAVAELGSAWPVLGGYYRWTRLASGDFWAFQQGWWQLLSGWTDNALYPVIISDYLVALMPALADSELPLAGGFAVPAKIVIRLTVIVALTVANLYGVATVGRLTQFFTLLLILPFVPFVLMGVGAWLEQPLEALSPFTPPGQPPLEALGLGMLIVMWGYSGYETASTFAHEIENPRRVLPRALIASVPLTVVSYALPLAAGLAVFGRWEEWTSGTLSSAAGAIGGAWLQAAVSFGAIASSLAIFNSYVLSYSRVPQAMAEDGLLPAFLARTHPRLGTPVASLVLNSCLYAAFAFLDFRELVVIDTILFAAAYILIFITLARLRSLHPDVPRPYRIPGGRAGLWAVVIVPTLVAVAACVAADFTEVRAGLAAASTGPVAYLGIRLWRRARAAASGRHTPTSPGR
jgi:amino acid transporter